MVLRDRVNISFFSVLFIALAACALYPTATAEPPTAEPTATPTETVVTCADIDANWGKDWNAVLAALEQLIIDDQVCGEEPLSSKKYAAHFNYGSALETNDEIEAAVAQYQAALELDPNRQEALRVLVRLDALPAPTPAPCLSSAPRLDPAPNGAPNLSAFVTVSMDQLLLNGEIFKVRGVNYYPRHTPWHRFIEEFDPVEIAAELDLISQAGLNTLRVFLWYEPLFTCEPETAIPNEAAFTKVDTLIQMAEERGLKLIVTLNDLPDLRFRPLYTDWEHYDTQTVYIVRRYRNEPTIIRVMWN